MNVWWYIMKKDDSTCEKHLMKKIFWGIIAVGAFMKAIEGPEHINKRCCKNKHNKIIYIYK